VQRRLNHETSSLEELKKLAEAAGYTVVAKLEQTREPDARYQIGAGKVEELATLVKETDAEKILFDNPLKAVQSYNLAKATGIEAIDRFKLILEIFTKRATTTEAKLQIQLATLQYELAHAKERVRLAKMKEQPGFMGLGAYEADVYHNAVKRQVQTIQHKLKKIREKRLLHRERRVELGFSTISLAGYTNVGKSSLFNALTEETGRVDRALFTTLSTTTRLVEISKRKFLLTDTVGFIDRLPLTLIEAFHSTLEETIYSDLIILVLDVSEPIETIEKKNNICLETIDRIGASGIPIITALNKIDLLNKIETKQKLEALKAQTKNPTLISALHQTNLELLKQEILKKLEDYVQASFSVPLTNQIMPFISWVHEKADVQKASFMGNFVQVVFEAKPLFAEKVRKRVEELDGKFEKATGPNKEEKSMQEIVVLRWGHRPQRDARLTTHVALAARALGASGFLLSDTVDEKIRETVEQVTRNWGGKFFFEMGTAWKSAVRDWKAKGGIVVHLTAYGENIQTSNVLDRIKNLRKDVLVIVGSQKAPKEFFSKDVSDFNVSIGNQPHSECAALAVFLDRFFEGKELSKGFKKAKIKIVPQERGKKTIVEC